MMKYSRLDGDDTLVIAVGAENLQELREKGVTATLIGVSGFDWDEALSPWPAEAVFRKAAPFAGKAEDTLRQITEMMADLQGSGRKVIAGYSLAGLFALWACTVTDVFDGCASCSGSMWYPGFTEYMRDHPVKAKEVYLSLGTKEKNSRNPVLASVEEKTAEVNRIISEQIPCILEFNEGNHFNDESGRLAKGIRYLTDH